MNDKKLNGRNIKFRLAKINDAEFILKLRLEKGGFLSKTDVDLKNQVNWLKEYKIREQKKIEYYFIIKDKCQNKDVGTIRIYNIQGGQFSWGSWVVITGSPYYVAIESCLLLYDFAFYDLNLDKSCFDVRKGNKKVVSFHEKFGASVIKEDSLNYFFNFSKDDYKNIKSKYKKFLHYDNDPIS